MPSCMVYALVQMMTFMVDTIVAGHYLGSDAVAAVALGLPVIGLMIPVPLEKLLALKKYGDRTTELDVSIPTDARNVSFVSEQLQSFLLKNGVPPKTAYASALCMEEIAADYLEHKSAMKNSGKKAYMDIKVFRDAEKIEIILRNYDDPYNPLVFEREENSFSKIGVSMVQKTAKDIVYSYSYHLNVVSVVIEA